LPNTMCPFHVNCCERTIHMLTDNMPALAWQQKGSTTTTGMSAYLLCLQVLHQLHYCYAPRLAHLKGSYNVMADDCSQLWQLSDQALLTHFSLHYPQSEPWQLCQLRPNMHSSLISALHKQQPSPASLLDTVIGAITPGKFGPASVSPSAKILVPFGTSQTPSTSSRYLQPASKTGALLPVVDPSGMQQYLPRCASWARRSPIWGSRTLA
jgi:hypothetical protein